jgi:hypothetical protein
VRRQKALSLAFVTERTRRSGAAATTAFAVSFAVPDVTVSFAGSCAS